jgi:hypothetical protein
MAIHNVTDSALLVLKSRKTIQRYIANGKLTVTRDDLGNPQIDTTELLRVFGKLSQQNNDDRVDKLLSAVERLEKVVEKQSQQIASLLQLEHKPVKLEPIEEPPTDKPIKSGTVQNDYFYGMTFVTKK